MMFKPRSQLALHANDLAIYLLTKQANNCKMTRKRIATTAQHLQQAKKMIFHSTSGTLLWNKNIRCGDIMRKIYYISRAIPRLKPYQLLLRFLELETISLAKINFRFLNRSLMTYISVRFSISQRFLKNNCLIFAFNAHPRANTTELHFQSESLKSIKDFCNS